jgi:L-serine/L-threonine ammonia-lyase
MECWQPVGSFKIRGIGEAAARAIAGGARHLVSSSGGNAGYAVAYAGRRLGAEVTVVVPETTSPAMRARLTGEGAAVIVHGAVWDDAHAHALGLAGRPGCAYVSPFDDPAIWDGHATIATELAEQLGAKPGAVVLSVGGGGLLCGIVQGLHAVGWGDVPVVAVETHGAASYAAALAAGAPVTLDRIDSIAYTLGARRVADQAVAWARRHPIAAIQVSDRDAVAACLAFVDEHRVLVEPSCGATLAAVAARPPALAAARSIVAIACGGAAVSVAQLQRWAAELR